VTKHRVPLEEPLDAANEMFKVASKPTPSPTAHTIEGASPRPVAVEALEGQLGPDEISEPDEVIKNNEAKLHHH
jgi:hypothetical protein